MRNTGKVSGDGETLNEVLIHLLKGPYKKFEIRGMHNERDIFLLELMRYDEKTSCWFRNPRAIKWKDHIVDYYEVYPLHEDDGVINIYLQYPRMVNEHE